jgi:hypothetical protein
MCYNIIIMETTEKFLLDIFARVDTLHDFTKNRSARNHKNNELKLTTLNILNQNKTLALRQLLNRYDTIVNTEEKQVMKSLLNAVLDFNTFNLKNLSSIFNRLETGKTLFLIIPKQTQKKLPKYDDCHRTIQIKIIDNVFEELIDDYGAYVNITYKNGIIKLYKNLFGKRYFSIFNGQNFHGWSYEDDFNPNMNIDLIDKSVSVFFDVQGVLTLLTFKIKSKTIVYEVSNTSHTVYARCEKENKKFFKLNNDLFQCKQNGGWSIYPNEQVQQVTWKILPQIYNPFINIITSTQNYEGNDILTHLKYDSQIVMMYDMDIRKVPTIEQNCRIYYLMPTIMQLLKLSVIKTDYSDNSNYVEALLYCPPYKINDISTESYYETIKIYSDKYNKLEENGWKYLDDNKPWEEGSKIKELKELKEEQVIRYCEPDKDDLEESTIVEYTLISKIDDYDNINLNDVFANENSNYYETWKVLDQQNNEKTIILQSFLKQQFLSCGWCLKKEYFDKELEEADDKLLKSHFQKDIDAEKLCAYFMEIAYNNVLNRGSFGKIFDDLRTPVLVVNGKVFVINTWWNEKVEKKVFHDISNFEKASGFFYPNLLEIHGQYNLSKAKNENTENEINEQTGGGKTESTVKTQLSQISLKNQRSLKTKRSIKKQQSLKKNNNQEEHQATNKDATDTTNDKRFMRINRYTLRNILKVFQNFFYQKGKQCKFISDGGDGLLSEMFNVECTMIDDFDSMSSKCYTYVDNEPIEINQDNNNGIIYEFKSMKIFDSGMPTDRKGLVSWNGIDKTYRPCRNINDVNSLGPEENGVMVSVSALQDCIMNNSYENKELYPYPHKLEDDIKDFTGYTDLKQKGYALDVKRAGDALKVYKTNLLANDPNYCYILTTGDKMVFTHARMRGVPAILFTSSYILLYNPLNKPIESIYSGGGEMGMEEKEELPRVSISSDMSQNTILGQEEDKYMNSENDSFQTPVQPQEAAVNDGLPSVHVSLKRREEEDEDEDSDIRPIKQIKLMSSDQASLQSQEAAVNDGLSSDQAPVQSREEGEYVNAVNDGLSSDQAPVQSREEGEYVNAVNDGLSSVHASVQSREEGKYMNAKTNPQTSSNKQLKTKSTFPKVIFIVLKKNTTYDNLNMFGDSPYVELDAFMNSMLAMESSFIQKFVTTYPEYLKNIINSLDPNIAFYMKLDTNKGEYNCNSYETFYFDCISSQNTTNLDWFYDFRMKRIRYMNEIYSLTQNPKEPHVFTDIHIRELQEPYTEIDDTYFKSSSMIDKEYRYLETDLLHMYPSCVNEIEYVEDYETMIIMDIVKRGEPQQAGGTNKLLVNSINLYSHQIIITSLIALFILSFNGIQAKYIMEYEKEYKNRYIILNIILNTIILLLIQLVSDDEFINIFSFVIYFAVNYYFLSTMYKTV